MRTIPPIAAISFDIDHTLIDFEAVLEKSLYRVSQVIAAEISVVVSVDELVGVGKQTFASYEGDTTDFSKIRKLSFHKLLESRQLDTDFVDMLFDAFMEERFRQTVFMPGAEELLSNIPAGIKIAVLSNGNSDPKRLGFAHYFEEILIGENLAEKKPHGGAFSRLMEALSVSDPAQILHVGDSLHDDVKGAKDAGVKAIWYNPAKVEFDGSTPPDHEISNLEDILQIIENQYVISET